jgi:methylthioribose-1-phosphate isomerase
MSQPEWKILRMEPNNMDLEDHRDQSPEKATKDGDSGRLGSESDISNLKQPGAPRMSRIHDIAFILTICTAQIMALAGVGQALGMFEGTISRLL